MDRQRFFTGKAYDEFLMETDGYQDLYRHHYQRAVVADEDKAFLKKLGRLYILVLTETWCGDSIAVLPVVRKWIESVEEVTMRILSRDENPDVMDNYLTNGGRSIPKFVFFDQAFREIGSWGPRPQCIQAIFEQHRDAIKAGEIEKSEVIKKMRRGYAADKGKSIIQEMKELLTSRSK